MRQRHQSRDSNGAGTAPPRHRALQMTPEALTRSVRAATVIAWGQDHRAVLGPRDGSRNSALRTLLLMIFFLFVWGCSAPAGQRTAGQADQKVIILGVDGLDPHLLERFTEAGHLPNFRRLRSEGDFRPLQTTMPPLSPVAWSTFITGRDPGGHEIYDFLHRSPQTLMPELSLSRVIPAESQLELGSWVFPLSSGSVELLRRGTAFWELLSEAGVESTIYRMPANFPPVPLRGRALSGMGTPDLLGTPGTFTFFTSDPPENWDDVSGGRIYPIDAENHKVEAVLEGPENTFRRIQDENGRGDWRNPRLTLPFQVYIDSQYDLGKFEIQGQEFVLKEGEWSDWVPLEFEALPFLVSVSAAARFYLQSVRPEFQLYVSPLQISPANPALPVSEPGNWVVDLHDRLGYFYTQELPEETKAFSAGIFSGQEFWEQSQFVFDELRQSLELALEEFSEGLLFFYFSSVDQGSHMLWQYMDPDHPNYNPDQELADGILTLYRQMDQILGRVMDSMRPETTLIVMSDHGFSPFYRGVNLNSWLAERGYVRLRDPSRQGEQPLFANVDWSGTRAYALGLNGLYVNLRGRERNGIVSPSDYDRLLDDLERDLLDLRDPRSGEPVVTLVTRPQKDFLGADRSIAPDLIVGYNSGYRSSWENPLGEFPREIFVDNQDAWSGDHSIDYRLVPGVLLANRRITLERPALYDLTVAVLDEFQVPPGEEMIGKDCLANRVSNKEVRNVRIE